MVSPSFPYLLLGLHHIQDVSQVDAGQQLHGGVVFRGGENLDTVVIRQGELVRQTQSWQQSDQQIPSNHLALMTTSLAKIGSEWLLQLYYVYRALLC